MRLSLGLTDEATACEVWDVARMRREQERRRDVAMALSLCQSVHIALAGGRTSDVIKPFYTDAEWEELKRRGEDERQLLAQKAQVAKLMRLSHGRG